MPRHRFCGPMAFCVSPLDWPFVRTPLVHKRGTQQAHARHSAVRSRGNDIEDRLRKGLRGFLR
jgi:hypothetical protein